MTPLRVITVASNKGGVGKTTLATNLPVYVRALHEDLPILVLGLDDQDLIGRMFALDGSKPARTVLEALRDRDLVPAIQLGQYGVHYVPPSPVISNLEAGLRDPFVLRDLLVRSGWAGLVVIDTKSDLGTLTQSAIAASDLVLLPVSDRTSLDQAERIYALFDAWGRPRERARVLLSLIDRRVKYATGAQDDILGLLVAEARRRTYPLLDGFVSRSPKIESLYTNPEGRAQSILHGAHGSLIHRQLAHLAVDVLRLLDELGPLASYGTPTVKTRPAPERRLWSIEELLGPTPAATPERAERRRVERRAFSRQLPAFRLEDPPILALQARDLSLGGVGVDPMPGLRVGSRVHLALPREPGKDPLLVWARVVRADAKRAGLSFESPGELRDRERLATLVASLAPATARAALDPKSVDV